MNDYPICIAPNLYVGTLRHYQDEVYLDDIIGGYLVPYDGWAVLHAAKEPYHREFVGYEGRGAPKGDPEYLFARRGDRLALNLIDADDPKYIPKEVIDVGLAFIGENLGRQRRVLVHCNMGASRAPSIGLLYLHTRGHCVPQWPGVVLLDPEEGMEIFREIYPGYAPGGGMREFLRKHWDEYAPKRQKPQIISPKEVGHGSSST